MEPFHADWFGQYKYDSFSMQSLQKMTDDNYSIRFKISNNCSTIRFDSKWKKHYSHSTNV